MASRQGDPPLTSRNPLLRWLRQAQTCTPPRPSLRTSMSRDKSKPDNLRSKTLNWWYPAPVTLTRAVQEQRKRKWGTAASKNQIPNKGKTAAIQNVLCFDILITSIKFYTFLFQLCFVCPIWSLWHCLSLIDDHNLRLSYVVIPNRLASNLSGITVSFVSAWCHLYLVSYIKFIGYPFFCCDLSSEVFCLCYGIWIHMINLYSAHITWSTVIAVSYF